MIQVSTTLGDALRGRSITAVSFITLGFDTPLTITEAPRDMTVDGVTYTSADNLIAISAPETQNAVDRDNYTIVFSDADSAMRQRFIDAGVHGVPLTVRLGLFDDDDVFISDLLNVYQGQSAAMSWSEQSGGYRLEVGFTGQLTQLDSVNTFLTSPESQTKIDPLDRSMDAVTAGVNDDAIRWGRKT